MNNDILVKIGADITDFSRKMAESQRQLKTFSTANQQTFDSFKKVGKVATVTGIALAGGLGFAVKKAAEFESGMSKVAAVSGASEKDLVKLTDAARDWGKRTSFSAKEAAEGLEYMALAGWKTEDMLGGLGPILYLAEAGALDLGRASDLVTDSMSALGVGVDELDGYLDKVAATASNSNTDIDALMEAFVVAGGTFSRFNVPLEEANAFLGILANRGTKGSEAGTALNAIMTRIGQSTGPAADALEEMGVSAYDSTGKFRGMETVMTDIQKEMEGMTDKEKAHYTQQLAGLNHGKSFTKMLQGLGDEYGDLKGNVENSTGALEKMRDTMKDNLQGALENLSSAFEEIMISIGDALLPAVKLLVSGLQWLADKFNALSDKTKSIIAITAAATAGFLLLAGPLLMLIGFIPSIIAGFTAITTVLSAISGPVVAVVAGIAALVAALIYAWNTSEKFREVVTEAFNYVREIITKVIGEVVAFVKELWGGLVEFWDEHGQMILEATRNVWETIWSVLSVVLTGIWETIKVAWDLIVEVVTIAWDLIKGVISGATEIIMGIIQTFAALFTGNWSEMWAGIQTIISGAWQIIQTIFVESLRLIFTAIDKGMDLIIQVVITVFTSMWKFIQTIFGLIVDYIKFAWDNSVKIVSDAAIAIFTWVSKKFNEVKTTVSTILSTVANTIRDKFQEGLTNVIKKVTEIYTTVSNKFSEVKTAVSDKMTEVKDSIIDLWDQAVQFLKDIDLFQIGADIINGLKEGIKSKAGDVAKAAKSVATSAVDGVKSFLKIKSPSRVMMEIGRYTGEGMANGIADMTKNVAKAATGLADAAVVEPEQLSLGYDTPIGSRSLGRTLEARISSDKDNTSQGITQNITVVSPDTTSPADNARKMKQASRELAMEWR